MENQLTKIDIKHIIEADQEMGSSETEYNPYRALIKMYKEIEEFGLTPVIYLDSISMKFYMTTQERQDKKLH